MAERSLLAAVSGIQANQTYLDEIGNNIANADTVGYKEGTVQFGDLLNEQITGATAPTTGTGGINPVAVGSGVRVSAVATQLSEGSLAVTGQATDVAITGSGYLVLKSNGQQLYTRNGALTVDASGDLTTLSGGQVQGWQANAAGTVNSNAPIGAITIPKGETIAAAASTEITLSGNLKAWGGSGTGTTATSTINAYDSLGNVIPVTVTLTPVATKPDEWSVSATAKKPNGTTVQLFTTTTPPLLHFDAGTGQLAKTTPITTGTVSTKTTGAIALSVKTMPTGYTFPAGDKWAIDFPKPGTSAAVTQFAAQKTFQLTGTDGYQSGSLQSYSIGGNGIVTGSFSNGKTQSIAQLALAGFANPSGLADVGNGLLSTSPNSGQPQIGIPGSGVLGSLLGGQLEQSNVTMGAELTDLITAQEAYQANTKVISTTQQMVQSLEAV
ncbi:MAG: flagellar hook protein FlgE [Acidimicrobiales bacterium]